MALIDYNKGQLPTSANSRRSGASDETDTLLQPSSLTSVPSHQYEQQKPPSLLLASATGLGRGLKKRTFRLGLLRKQSGPKVLQSTKENSPKVSTAHSGQHSRGETCRDRAEDSAHVSSVTDRIKPSKLISDTGSPILPRISFQNRNSILSIWTTLNARNSDIGLSFTHNETLPDSAETFGSKYISDFETGLDATSIDRVSYSAFPSPPKHRLYYESGRTLAACSPQQSSDTITGTSAPPKRLIMGDTALPSAQASPSRSPSSARSGEVGSPRHGNEPPIPSLSPGAARQNTTTAGIGSMSDGTPQNLSGLVCNVHRTTGTEPPALVGASTTILGDKLYVFGGRKLSRRRPHLTRRLYELDLVRRHWTRLQAHGKAPSPRYFHSLCPLGDTKLVCYGGMAPANQASGDSNHRASIAPADSRITVMSDVHIYDIPSQTWTAIPATDSPPGRYAHCATILPSSAVFSSATAPLSAIQHNPASSNPNQGSIGVTIDGTGGAEMVIVGGQDSASKYIESICVFNLRSLKWATSMPLGRSCGAYRSVVAPLIGLSAAQIGQSDKQSSNAAQSSPPSSRKTSAADESSEASRTNTSGCAMLLYSNYNFLDVKLELQVRHPDGSLQEKAMRSVSQMPPGLRFPNGGVVNNHLVISGTFLTSTKQEYALWALNLKTLNWSRVDVGLSSVSAGSGASTGVFSTGSWNRGLVWKKRNAFVVLGNRKRNLGEDYHHRRLNFTNFCVVELEAFGLYDNPRNNAYRATPVRNIPEPSLSAPLEHPSMKKKEFTGGVFAAENLGIQALAASELCDMDFLAIGGERIPVNSHMIAWRWGPYFHQLIKESNSRERGDGSQNNMGNSMGGSTLASGSPKRPNPNSRYSNITVTPSLRTVASGASTVVPNTGDGDAASVNTAIRAPPSAISAGTTLTANTAKLQPPFFSQTPITKYSRLLYFPHTLFTLRALVHYLYTGFLPPPTSHLCTPQILCSLLQIARPYRIDGLLEATVQRLHEILDARNTAAVFNAAAMAAGGGEAVAFTGVPMPFRRPSYTTQQERNQYSSQFGAIAEHSSGDDILSSMRRSRDLRQPGRAVMHLTNGSGGAARSLAGKDGAPEDIDGDDHGFIGGALHGGGVVSSSRNGSFSDSRKNSADDSATADRLSNSSRSTSTTSMSDLEPVNSTSSANTAGPATEQEVWAGGDPSQVIGLQKRGLRGLMEGRKLREREAQQQQQQQQQQNLQSPSNSTSVSVSATA